MMMSYLTMVPPWSCPGPGPGPEELGSSKAPPPLSYSLGSLWRANRLSGWSTHDVLQQRNIKQHLHNSAPADVWSGLSPRFSLCPSGVGREMGRGQRSVSQTHRVESLHLKVVWVMCCWFMFLFISVLCCSSPLHGTYCWSDLLVALLTQP